MMKLLNRVRQGHAAVEGGARQSGDALRWIAFGLSIAALGLVAAAICRRGVGFELPAALACCTAGHGALIWARHRDGA